MPDARDKAMAAPLASFERKPFRAWTSEEIREYALTCAVSEVLGTIKRVISFHCDNRNRPCHIEDVTTLDSDREQFRRDIISRLG